MHFKGAETAHSLVHKVPFAEFVGKALGIGASAGAAVGACSSVETAIGVSGGESLCVGDLRHAVAVAIMTVKSTRVFIVRLNASNALGVGYCEILPCSLF